jgi:NAD(P)-dependent dehydrogenase (short-subunit alcohol dehydrogenase family)
VGKRHSKNPVVVIVGASSGIGQATARRFAKRGARLVLAGRGEEGLDTVAEEVRGLGAEVLAVPTDVRDEDQVRELVRSTVERFGRIDVWVGNASVFSYGAFEDTPSEVFRDLIETDLIGQISGARAVLPVFRAQRSGTIVFVGSVYSKISTPLVSAYVTSKWGLLGFAEVLRQELRKEKGIAVCSVLPATIDTPIYQHTANYTGERVHPLPPIVAPSRVASAIGKLARKPRREVIVGRIQGSLVPFHNTTPGLYEKFAAPTMELIALRGGDEPDTPGTTDEPGPPRATTTGGWRKGRGLRLVGAVAAVWAVSAAVRRVKA